MTGAYGARVNTFRTRIGAAWYRDGTFELILVNSRGVSAAIEAKVQGDLTERHWDLIHDVLPSCLYHRVGYDPECLDESLRDAVPPDVLYDVLETSLRRLRHEVARDTKWLEDVESRIARQSWLTSPEERVRARRRREALEARLERTKTRAEVVEAVLRLLGRSRLTAEDAPAG